MGAEFGLHVVGPRLPVHVGDLHAARVVYQHAEEVLLGAGGADHQQRPEEADENNRQDREANGGQRDAIARAAAARSIGQDGQAYAQTNEQRRHVRAGGGRKPVFALAKNDGRQFEEKPEDGVEHECLRILLRGNGSATD